MYNGQKKSYRATITSIILASFSFGTMTTPAHANIEPIPNKQVLIDTDMAPDDWAAVLYLLNRPDVIVKGIAVDGNGEANCDLKNENLIGAKNALGLIALAGKESENIPVACGSAKSIQTNHVFPQEWRVHSDTVFGIKLPESTQKPLKIDAVPMIVSILENSTEKVDILALGPLTNLGVVLRDYPSVTKHIGTITIMGGAVNVPGNLHAPGAPETNNDTAEWNIFIDPHAANLVFKSGLPIQLVSLDGTQYAKVTMDFLERLGANSKTPSSKFVYNYLSEEIDFIKTGKFDFWDPLSAVIITHPDICRFEEYTLSVDESEGNESGRTKFDPDGNAMQVCVKADGQKFESIFIDSINQK